MTAPDNAVTRHREGLKPESYLAILSHHVYHMAKGLEKEVAVGTVIQDTQRGNEDRHQRWDRLERADLFEQYGDLHSPGALPASSGQGA